ncbi:invasion associated locus B family protein [Paracoccaceae bacterium]|nr:invasion associated locus B family protein [Paracoccaceae bacterium]
MPKYRNYYIFKKYFFAWNLILAYTFLFVLGTLTVYAEEADNLSIDDAMAVETQKPQPYIKETNKDWNLKCIAPQNSTERCEANQLIVNDKKQPVAEISIFKLSDNQVAEAAATIIVPLETILSEGLILAIQDLEPKKYQFKFCNSLGCYAQIGLTKEEVEALKNKERASIYLNHISSGDQQVIIPISLAGFMKTFSKVIKP